MQRNHTGIENRTTDGKTYRWVVVCTCGYESRLFERLRDAENDEVEHSRHAHRNER